MSWPFSFAGAMPEVNVIPGIFTKVWFNSRGQWYDYVLKWVDFGFQDFLSCRDRIGEIKTLLIVQGVI